MELLGTNIYYNSPTDYNNIQPQSISYEGVKLSFSSGPMHNATAEALNNGAAALLKINGTLTFPASAFQGIAPFLADASDSIGGGGGTNTVVYQRGLRGLRHPAAGEWIPADNLGDDRGGAGHMADIQALQFLDVTASVTASGGLLVHATAIAAGRRRRDRRIGLRGCLVTGWCPPTCKPISTICRRWRRPAISAAFSSPTASRPP